jgi:acyl-CoA reductase-like NAD-dependent aldehyde dehydrogenase
MGVARKQVVNHTVRGAFDYQGQKCSATSRMCVRLTAAADRPQAQAWARCCA